MSEIKFVFCEHCREQINEQDALYVRNTGKFFHHPSVKRECLMSHHPRPTGIFEVKRKTLDQQVTQE